MQFKTYPLKFPGLLDPDRGGDILNDIRQECADFQFAEAQVGIWRRKVAERHLFKRLHSQQIIGALEASGWR
eukprot:4179759-Pyramimonas_sp.AAC.1